jgi:hypothetical protein
MREGAGERTIGCGRAGVQLALLVLIASLGALAVQQHRAQAAPAPSTPLSGTLVVTQWRSAPDTSGTPSAQTEPTNSSATATITVVIPARTLVRVDGRGRPTAAATNTRQAPQPSDQFVVDTDGQPFADASVVAAVLAHSSNGDWAVPGVWHTL